MRLDRDDHLAVLGELDRVAEQVDQDLAQPGHVADDHFGCLRGDQVGQLQPLLGSPGGQQVERALDALAQVKRLMLEFQLVGLDLREIEDVVDDRQQAIRRCRGRSRRNRAAPRSVRCRAAGWSCR